MKLLKKLAIECCEKEFDLNLGAHEPYTELFEAGFNKAKELICKELLYQEEGTIYCISDAEDNNDENSHRYWKGHLHGLDDAVVTVRNLGDEDETE